MFGSAPAAPDYTGAAREQGQAGRQLTAEQTYANRPDISTPWGGVRWAPPTFDPYYGGGGGGGGGYGGGGGGGGFRGSLGDNVRRALGAADNGEGGGGGGGGAPGRWGMEMYLSPEQEAALASQQRITSGRSGLAEEMLGRVRGELGGAPDFSALPQVGDVAGARTRAEEALYGRATSRLDPEWQQRQEQLDVQLRNQGVLPGSPLYQRQMQDFERAREGAYAGARRESVIGGGAEAEREQGIGLRGRQAVLAELLQRRGWSLNEIQALLSGQQINMPQMPGFSQAGVSQPPDLLGAARSAYQSQLDRFNAQQAGLQGMFTGASNLATLPFLF